MTTCLSGLLFAYWLVVGYALASRLLPSRQAIPKLLLAPSLGFAATELALFTGMRTCEPLQTFCIPLVGALFSVSIISLLVTQPVMRLRYYVPFAGLLVLAFVLNGWPLIRYGQDWIGHCSHDMSNYCMAAEDFKNHGVTLTEQDLAEYNSGRDYKYPVRSWYIDSRIRRGTEISLGTFCLVSNCQSIEVCMAFALAMHLMLVSATGFLAYRHLHSRKVALGATAFLVVSAASALGLLEQMLGQIGGLGLLAAGIGVLCRPAYRLPLVGVIRRTITGGILLGALTLQYPEVWPFLVATIGGITGIGVIRRRIDWYQLGIALVSALLGIGLLGKFGLDLLSFLGEQMAFGGNGQCVLHRYHQVYKTAHGLLLVCGMQSRVDYPEIIETIHDTWSWARLVFGAGVLGICLVLATVLAWRRRGAWIAFGIMAAACVVLYHSQAWYGLHKISMYIQPFLATVVAGLVVSTRRKIPRVVAFTLFIGLLATNATAQFRSVNSQFYGNFANGAKTGLVTELQAIRDTPADRFYVATESIVLTRFLTIPIGDREAVMTMSTWSLGNEMWALLALPREEGQTGTERIDRDPLVGGTPKWLAKPLESDYLIVPGYYLSALNRSRYASESPTNLKVGPINKFRNHLIFRESVLSKFDYPAERDDAASFSPNASIAVLHGVGNYHNVTSMMLGSHLTLQVLNPSARIRLVMSASSPLPEWAEELPDIAVYGRSLVEFGFGGSLSGRIISPPIEPAHEGSLHTLRIDLTRKNASSKPTKAGPLTVDHMATFCHDLSVISEEDYLSHVPPAFVDFSKPPMDYPLLEYCGGYELGWMGKGFRVRLASTPNTPELVIRGLLPQMSSNDNFQTDLTILIDGMEIFQKQVTPGTFEVRIPGVKPGAHWIDFRCSTTRQYPPDTRAFSVQLQSIEFGQNK